MQLFSTCVFIHMHPKKTFSILDPIFLNCPVHSQLSSRLYFSLTSRNCSREVANVQHKVKLFFNLFHARDLTEIIRFIFLYFYFFKNSKKRKGVLLQEGGCLKQENDAQNWENFLLQPALQLRRLGAAGTLILFYFSLFSYFLLCILESSSKNKHSKIYKEGGIIKINRIDWITFLFFVLVPEHLKINDKLLKVNK